ncbi:MAG: class I SAM-dependent methyltransferase [Deltaproteobacteria bacterium]|nr:class I SAM-dependent methyltransferase [Deltaproteobacteria bacterium]
MVRIGVSPIRLIEKAVHELVATGSMTEARLQLESLVTQAFRRIVETKRFLAAAGLSGRDTIGSMRWYDDDEFWRIMAPKIFGAKTQSTTQAEVEQLIALMKLTSGSSVLDLACGQGRHSLELARRGYRVTGVDRTRDYLETARKSASRERLIVEWVEGDMREFCRPDSFDGGVNLYTSFGYFADPADDLRVLTHVYESLHPGSPFVIDVVGQEVFLRSFTRQATFDIDGIHFLEERILSADRTILTTQYTATQGRSRRTFTISHRLYSAETLTALLRTAGFKGTRVFGSLEGTPYDESAKRLVVLAHK